MRIPIPADCAKIHVLFSGGADSTLLLHLLLKEKALTHNPVPIKCYWMGVKMLYSKIFPIIKYLELHFNAVIECQAMPRLRIRPAVQTIQLFEPGYVFSGCNKVVEGMFTPTRTIPGDTPPWRGPVFNDHHIRPFIDLDKIEIMKLYKAETTPHLLALTHSCGLEVDRHCGECYFCLERAWGLAEADINMPYDFVPSGEDTW